MLSKSYLFLLIVLGLAGLSLWLYTTKAYNYGLDVKGGVRLIYRMKTDELKQDQRSRLDDVRTNLVRILTNRASTSLGVNEATVQQKGLDEFIVELPGFTDPQRAREILNSTASIMCYHAKNIVTDKASYRPYIEEHEDNKGKPLVTFRKTSTNEIIRPNTPEYLEIIKGWDLILKGEDLAKAYGQVRGSNTVPMFEFSSEGARKMEAWSRRVLNRGEKLAFVLDNQVLNIAPLKDGAILSNEAFIEGTFDPAYVNNLSTLLNAGALPVSLIEESSQSVDPTIGNRALTQIVNAGMIAFAVICVFLVVYYAFPGLVAVLALGLYVLFTLTALKLIGATFSLAAIAGFILSVGMAVDANILVFERVKEELREGRTLMKAVELGFSRALPAIIDSNACTLITSLVLATYGTGPVKGFASTLIIGVLISLFTAVTVTRSLLVFLVGSGMGASEKWFGLNRQWFGEGMEKTADHKPLQIVNTAKRWFIISLATIIPGLIFVGIGGLKPNVEFSGGYEATYSAPGGITGNEIVSKLEKSGIKGANVKFATIGNGRFAYVTVPPTKELKSGSIEAYTHLAELTGLQTLATPSLTEIGPSVQRETLRNAILGVVLSSTLIVLYLAIRFGFALGGFVNGIRFGTSAILALVHDILVVLGVAAIVGYFAGWEVSALFITAMLTVIGFSVHDTIVIFDRIRENLRRPVKGEDFGNLSNRSITQSFARSINTSLTVVATLLILIIAGTPTPDLKFFCLAMLTGIVSGTYSSIYNASPILYLWDKAVMAKRGPEAGLIAEAAREHARLRAAALTVDGSVGGQSGPSQSGQYGQVKRRSSAVQKAKQMLDDDE